jgi:hypothetical protein
MLAMHGLAFTFMFNIHPLLSINLFIEVVQDLQEFAAVRGVLKCERLPVLPLKKQ